MSALTPYAPGVPETLLGLVYDALAAPSPYLADAGPWLATAIVPEGDGGRAWRITVRDDVRWHDGAPFSAADVAFTLRAYRDGPVTRWGHHVSMTPRVETIEALDRRTVRVVCERPCPFFDLVTAADLPILPAHLWRGVTEPHRYAGPIVGTGPYRVAAMVPGRSVRLVAHPQYFGGRPRVEEIVVSFIRQPATAFAALHAGELDLVVAPAPPEWVESIARRGDLALAGGASPLQAVEMRLDFDRPPLDDPAFRRALVAAIDTGELVERIAFGRGVPGRVGFPPPGNPWTAPGLVQASDDPAAARAGLDALGFRDRDGDGRREDPAGRPLRLGISVASNEALFQRAAQVVKRQLAAVGLAARIEIVDPGRLRASYRARQFDLMIGELGPHSLVDPDQWLVSTVDGYLWREGLPDASMAAAVARWRQAATREARLAAGWELQRLHAAAPAVVVLYYPQLAQVYRRAAFAGYRPLAGQGIFHKWSFLELAPLPSWLRN